MSNATEPASEERPSMIGIDDSVPDDLNDKLTQATNMYLNVVEKLLKNSGKALSLIVIQTDPDAANRKLITFQSRDIEGKHAV